ncbi:MFS transporter [Mycetocola saprophilus]|uniref:MFS transporter n=1 Tax=Mycetocola saprophilus TaxID=76636 RepID=UPI0004C0235A|nr:MFS transporter [Mycetocola saprophilus]
MRRRRVSTEFAPALLALGATQVLASTAAGLALTVVTPVAYQLSRSEQIAGLSQTAMILGASLLTLPIAALSRRRGRRTALGTAFSLAALGAMGTVLAITAESWPLFLIALVLIGGGTVGALATRFAAADAVTDPIHLPLAISLILWAGTSGSLIGPNLMSLTGGTKTASPFIVLLVLYALAAGISFLWAPAGAIGADGRRPGVERRNLPTVLRRHPAAIFALVLTLVSHSVMIALMGMAPVHLVMVDTPAGLVGMMMSAHLVAMYVLSPVFGLLARWRGARFVGLCGLVLSGTTAVVLALSHSGASWMFTTGLTLLGFGWSMSIVAGSVLVSESIPPRERGRLQGLMDLTMNVSGGCASIIAGTLTAVWSYGTLAWASGALAGVTLVLIGVLRFGAPRKAIPE